MGRARLTEEEKQQHYLEQNAKRKEYQRLLRENNNEKIKAYKKRYYEKHKEELSQMNKFRYDIYKKYMQEQQQQSQNSNQESSIGQGLESSTDCTLLST